MSRASSLTRVWRTGAVAALALLAAACSGGNKDTAQVVTPTPPAGPTCDAFLEQFGLGFCTAYKQAANSEPKEVAAGDVVPPDLTKEPVAVP